jgi:hypothetical protein
MTDKEKYRCLYSINSKAKKCPGCGNKLYGNWLDNVPSDACLISESCDEGRGTTGYIAICGKNFYEA